MKREWNELAPLPLRLILGFGMAFHDWEKVADGTQSFHGILETIGIPGGAATAWFVAILELAGGIALIVGAFVPVVAALLMVTCWWRWSPCTFRTASAS